jgi:hypothetical protein
VNIDETSREVLFSLLWDTLPVKESENRFKNFSSVDNLWDFFYNSFICSLLMFQESKEFLFSKSILDFFVDLSMRLMDRFDFNLIKVRYLKSYHSL